MSNVYYEGIRTEKGCKVLRFKNGRLEPLGWKLDLWNYSPTGFEWGYGGSGPAQLALALLWDVLRSDDQAVEHHQTFKWEIVAKLPKASWMLTRDAIAEWCIRRDQQVADLKRQREEEEEPFDLRGPEEDPAKLGEYP